MDLTVVPQLSVPAEPDKHGAYVAFSDPVPTRRVVLVWQPQRYAHSGRHGSSGAPGILQSGPLI
jgi:hypothetical protein